ncbi:response regulator transcription factor [Nocardioides mangrovi]|uniref:Response regulator n=1 Tax=Nocardioides mangrovi TaxID=2874580 RepID=A0ABS7U7T2_9ACTN|nr:response regulator [Nocardioides mangrovi]MBZ5737043.1 response regulator [Nocardioides mangrovi]
MSVQEVAARPVALVIEDDPDVSDLLDTVLTMAGFSVVTAENGLEGIAIAREYEPVLVTTDVAMPEMDGLEATRRIREFSPAYIVVISTRSREDDILAGFAAGADDYLAKPIRPRELRARLAAAGRRPVSEMLPEDVSGWNLAEVERLRADIAAADGDARDLAGMLELGMRFVGDWVEFRGLRIDPDRDIVVIDDREVVLPVEQVDLLEVLLYAGTRMVTSRQVALRLRAETEATATASREDDDRWVEGLVAALRTSLGESVEAPRWFEEVAPGRFRLVRPEGD